MRKNIAIYIALSVLVFTLACAFVQNMILPPDTPIPSPLPLTPTPTASFTATPEIINTPTLEIKNGPEPIACSGNNCLNACLERLDEVLATAPFEAVDNSIYEEQDADFNLVIYQVDGDQIKDPVNLYVPPDYRKYQEDTAAHFRIWDFYAAIIPPELREMVAEFVIFTDGGGGDVGAWVTQMSRDPNKWQVGFDILDSDYPPYLADALIHETGHILTLNTSQMPYEDLQYYSYDAEQNIFHGCSQYAEGSTCSLPDSYIDLFYERFWKDVYADWSEVEQESLEAESFEEYLQVMEQFYDDHDELYLNSYAATNISEDMAESFSYFVLNPEPTGNSIPEQKVAFYYEFPELVEYRRQIIEGLCSYAN
ncbi:MAG TPA: hypothetical protein VJ785_11260 [Anaerolineales bacterium]|nr:hypothetical protein [Anaerolineales bacterium]